MQAKAVLKYQRMSRQKVALVADKVRGKAVDEALDILQFTPKKAAKLILKVLESALANAEHNQGMDVGTLAVSRIFVDQGMTMKRTRARAKGRATRELRRSCHITVVLSEG